MVISFLYRIFLIAVLFMIVPQNLKGFDLTRYFDLHLGHKSWLIYDYNYVEFIDNANLDSSIVLESFNGNITVTIDTIEQNADTTKYGLLLKKEGINIVRTFFDTLSVEPVAKEYMDTVFVIAGINEGGGNSYIYGWIFPDTLYESVSDPTDSMPTYPYSRLYRFYNIHEDTSLYYSLDTLFIHYRPKNTNYYDSY
ncbi:MAG: hypothetical protein GF313_03885, partial [Caldithrix sp.]|nr:hypothetical protein [Caldithrix sp.]